MMPKKRRFQWAKGEIQDPKRADLRAAIQQIKNLAAAAEEYCEDGAYAPLGGLLIYLRKDINDAMKAVRELTRTYSR
jgi:hypothetical protein